MWCFTRAYVALPNLFVRGVEFEQQLPLLKPVDVS